MSVLVKIPTPLRNLTGGKSEVEGNGSILKDLIEDLDGSFTGMKERLCEESGEVRRFINIFVNDEDIRFLQGVNTELKDGDEVSIIPAIAGGSILALADRG
jgi:molybdopterin synthase sulfur carrier subunit